jgi:hypothetical protein
MSNQSPSQLAQSLLNTMTLAQQSQRRTVSTYLFDTLTPAQQKLHYSQRGANITLTHYSKFAPLVNNLLQVARSVEEKLSSTERMLSRAEEKLSSTNGMLSSTHKTLRGMDNLLNSLLGSLETQLTDLMKYQHTLSYHVNSATKTLAAEILANQMARTIEQSKSILASLE